MFRVSENKFIDKATKIIAGLLLFILLLFGSLYFALTTPYFQTIITHRISDYLSGKLNTRIEIAEVNIENFKTIVLDGVYVEDLHHDTLIYAGVLKVNLRTLNLEKQILNINSVEVHDGKFYLKYYPNEADINLQFLIDAFSSSDTTQSPDTSKSKFTLQCSSVMLDDVAFRYRDFSEPELSPGVDYFNIHAYKIFGLIQNITIHSDTITGKVKYLSCNERSGFVLQKFSCLALVCNKSVVCDKLEIKTPLSHVKGNYSMHYSRYRDFKDYISKVEMRSHQENTEFNMSDVAYFAPDLWGMNQEVKVSGDVKGTVDRLKGKNLKIESLGNTKFSGNANITGLPDVDNTYLELDIKSLQTDRRSIENIPLPPFEKGEHVELPDIISELGIIKYQGKLSGFFTDFVSYGNLETALGNVHTDVNLKFTGNDTIGYYTGKIKTDNFHFGKLFGAEKILGQVSLNTEIKGSGFTADYVSANLNGHINSLFFNGYNYSNLDITGKASKGQFTGNFKADDPNLKMNFDGTIQFASKQPIYNFTTDISKANLSMLHVREEKNNAVLSAQISANFNGSGINNLLGGMHAHNLNYVEKGKKYSVKDIHLTSTSTGGRRELELNSDVADLKLAGTYSPEVLVIRFAQFLSSNFTGLNHGLHFASKADSIMVHDVDLSVQLKKPDLLNTLIGQEVSFAAGTTLNSHYYSGNEDFTFQAMAPKLEASGITLNQMLVDIANSNKGLKIDIHSESIEASSVYFPDLEVSATLKNDSLEFRCKLANSDSSKINIALNGDCKFRKHISLLHLTESKLIINSNTWQIEEGNELSFDSLGIGINNLNFTFGEQQVKAQGLLPYSSNALSEGKRYRVDIRHFDLNNTDWFLNDMNADLGGLLNGSVSVMGSMVNPVLGASVKVETVSFNEDTLGNATIDASYIPEQSLIQATASFGNDKVKTIQAKGKIDLARENDFLDFDIDFEKTYLKKFARYFESFAKDLRGIASGNLHLAGTFEQPILTGKVKLQKTSFGIEYLNTFYNFSDEIVLKNNRIEFNNITVNDMYGHTANVSGFLTHTHFRNFNFNVHIQPINFLCLNTTSSMNSIYYGKAFASGNIDITGTDEEVQMDVSVKSEKGSQLFIPLSNPEEVDQQGFIHFVSHDTSQVKIDKYVSEKLGLVLNMNIEVTPDAEIQIIFDEKVGDIMKGRGNGNLRMQLNADGDFNMFGDYVIEEGDYLFSFRNIINKKFDVSRGGTIKWTGNPMDADVNMDAIYKLKAALYDLTLDESDEDSKRRRPVECHMNMTGKLLNPNIKFDVTVPDLEAGNTAADLLKYYTATEEQRTTQVMSLLLLRRFYPPNAKDNNTVSTGNEVGSSSKELLSNQLNNWISQVSNKFDIGVNVTDEDVGASVGKGFFNDRILVDGSVKYNSNQSASQTSAIVGDANAEVKISKDGKFRLKYYYKSSAGTSIQESDVSKQGAGFSYKTEFNNRSELRERRKLIKIKRKLQKMQKEESNANP